MIGDPQAPATLSQHSLDGMTPEQIKERLDQIKRERIENMRGQAEYIRTHRSEFFRPFRWQIRANEAVRRKLITVAPAPNKIGKTAFVVVTVDSWGRGYEPWCKVSADYPGAVFRDGEYYKPSSLGIVPPVRVRLTGEEWSAHLGQTVIPEMKKWLCLSQWDVRKNTQGFECLWTHRETGSTIELLTHGMDKEVFESWFGHAWVPDEPPPHHVFKAMSRGLFGANGKILIPTTPLKEAWILDKLVLTNRSDVEVLRDLCCLDNELFYGDDDKVLTEMGLSGRETKFWREADGDKKQFFHLIMYVDDQGAEAEKFLMSNTDETKHHLIQKLKFLKFAKDTDSDEKQSRFFGAFKSLIGLVIKDYNPEIHIIRDSADFKVALDWPVTVMIDFHLHKPHAISFFACDNHNRHFYIEEVWENMTPEAIADLIIARKIGKDTLWNIQTVYIDPLSKGDDKYMKNRDESIEAAYTIIESRLDKYDIELDVRSKDKTSGYINIRKWLKGPNKIPILFFLDKIQSFGSTKHNGVLYEIQRLTFDDLGKVSKVDDDFMENLYGYTLAEVSYQGELSKHAREANISTNSGGGNNWLGA